MSPARKAWMRRAAFALALVCSTACVDDRSLRQQQAEELRRLCQSFALLNDGTPGEVARIGRMDLKRFEVGAGGSLRSGTDVFRTRVCLQL